MELYSNLILIVMIDAIQPMNFKSIHDQFNRILKSYISKKVNDENDVQDILQDIFIKISQNMHVINDKDKIKSWIFTIARNTITDYYRKNSRNPEIRFNEALSYDTIDETDDDFTMGLESCLKAFIQQLPDDYRDIIIDSELKGIKQKDLAVKYNLTYPTLRSRVQRGRARLKEMLVNCCSIDLDKRGNVISATGKKPGETECGVCE